MNLLNEPLDKLQALWAKDVLSSEILLNEMLILSLANNSYYGLDEVGAEMLSLMTQASSVGEARDQLLYEFDVSAEKLEKDIRELLEKMLSEKLIVLNPVEA